MVALLKWVILYGVCIIDWIAWIVLKCTHTVIILQELVEYENLLGDIMSKRVIDIVHKDNTIDAEIIEFVNNGVRTEIMALYTDPINSDLVCIARKDGEWWVYESTIRKEWIMDIVFGLANYAGVSIDYW